MMVAKINARGCASVARRCISERLAALRNAVAGEVTGADGLAAVRAAMARVFDKFTLVRTPEGELVLVPQMRAFDEIEAWVRLPDGRSAVKPLPQTVAMPEKKGQRTLLLSGGTEGAPCAQPDAYDTHDRRKRVGSA